LGRNAAEVMTTIRELAEHGIVLRSLREGIDTSNATGRMWRANWPALRNLSWSWVVSGGQQHARRVGHAGSTSEDRRHSIYPKQLWPSACTRAVSLRARLRRPSA
jgi:hypothetical protein